MTRYILDDSGNPVPCPDLLTWVRWFETAGDRVIAQDTVDPKIMVSTVFLGLDHNFSHGEPILWETLIFGGPHDGEGDRYTSRADAEKGHAKYLAIARNGQ